MAEDDYFLTLCRYVEGNALRAHLVERAEQWQWSALWRRSHGGGQLPLSPWPVDRPKNWTALVNAGISEERLTGLRQCVDRGRPWGPGDWVQVIAVRLGLVFTLRGPGRPRKIEENQ